MQLDGALQGGASTRPRRTGLPVLLAIVVIAGVVALIVWVVPLATSGVEAEEAVPKAAAGSAVVHDDAGNLPIGADPAVIHDDAGYVIPD